MGSDSRLNAQEGDLAQFWRAAAGPMMHGVRLACAVCLALLVTFYLQLSAPYWAGTTAAIVCLPVLGATLRKGQARLVGTIVGALFVLSLAALFPQNRMGMLLGMAAWCGACGFAMTLLDNFASYGVALAGYTAVIIAGTAIETPDQFFAHTISRASEISIGIACATVVLIVTARARAVETLANGLAAVIAETARETFAALRVAGPGSPDRRPARRALIKRTIALRPTIDDAIGESSEVRLRQSTLHAALEGVFEAISDWRTVAGHGKRLSEAEARRQTQKVVDALPDRLTEILASGDPQKWTRNPAALRDACTSAGRELRAMEAEDASLVLMASTMAEWLTAAARTANGLALLLDPARARNVASHRRGLSGKDLLPALINGLRVFATVVAAEVFWIATAWPSGLSAITFAAVNVILISPKNELAARDATLAVIGVGFAALIAATAKFALLPQQDSFVGLCLVLGLILVPFGALSAVPRLSPLFTRMTVNVLPFMALTNVISYDQAAFYNQMLGIVVGCVFAAIALQLIPPAPQRLRASRLLTATRDELRALAASLRTPSRSAWEARIYNRLAALPEAAEPTQAGNLVAALSVGTEIIRLRRSAEQFGLENDARRFLTKMARGDLLGAIAALREFDADLASIPRQSPGEGARLQSRANILALAEALDTHRAYLMRGALQ